MSPQTRQYTWIGLMCELLGVSSKVPTTVRCGLDQLARHSLAGPHRDGWGVAYYDDTGARVFRGAKAAAVDPLARQLAAQGHRSHLTVAHIRHATRGTVALRNTQPFVRNLGGREHVFAHNGDLSNVETLHEARGGGFHPTGETDSELAFCVLLERLRSLWSGSTVPPPLEPRLAALTEFAAWLRPLGPANFLYTDGDALFAHGHRRKQSPDSSIAPPGLYVLPRTCASGGEDFRAEGLLMSGAAQCIVLAASVPLTDEHWEPVAEGELVVARGGQIVARGR